MSSASVDKKTGTPLPTRKSVRRLRWFESSFRARMAAVSEHTGVQYDLSDLRLVDTFLAWHRAFDSQRPASRMVRRAYVSFATGMMFHELLRKRPVTALSDPAQNDPDNAALSRPEEYLYASYCHVIRQAILGQDFWLDTRKPDRLNDPAIWVEFSEEFAQDRTAAIAFFDLFANGTSSWKQPTMTTADGGFGKRLWTHAARHTNRDATTNIELANTGMLRDGPGLQLVSDRPASGQIHLPATTRLVLIAFEGVAAKTDIIDSQELSFLLAEYNVPLTPEEARERFFGQPLSTAMTLVAERTGQLCPGGFITKHDQRLIRRDKRDLVPMPGIDTLLQRLKAAQFDVAIVSHGRQRRVEAAQRLPAMSMLQSAGAVHMLTPDNSPANGLETLVHSFGHSPPNAVLIDASSVGIGMARSLSMATLGFVGQTRFTDRNALSCAGAQGILTDLVALIC